ncbi:MAG: S-layer homology domain-containing protein [Candidatus Ornithomonoglobus sp.]
MKGIKKITAFLLLCTFSLSVFSSGYVYAYSDEKYEEDINIAETVQEYEASEPETESIHDDVDDTARDPEEAAEDDTVFVDEWWDAIQDGDSFDVDVRMFRWPYSEPPSYSMGNGALTGNARLLKEDGMIYVELDFCEIDMGSTIGHLIKFWYIPDQASASDQYAMADALTAMEIPAENQNINTYLDVCAEECEYTYKADGTTIDYVRLPLENDEEHVICGIESDFEAMGRQLCVMSFDYSNAIEAITGIKPEKIKQVGTPSINTILSADGGSFEIAISIPRSAEASDADIYYLVSGSDEADLGDIVSEDNRYRGSFEVSKDEAAEMGGAGNSFNVYAVGVKEGYENSVVNLKKITFYNDSTASPAPSEAPQITAGPSETEDPFAASAPDVTSAPAMGGSGSSGGSSDGSSGGSGSGADYSNIADGKYRVQIALYHLSAEQLSMGNSAFENNSEAIINIVGGTGTITCASNPVSIPPYYSALKTMLFKNSSGDWQKVTTLDSKTITANDGTNTYSLTYLSMFSFKLPNIDEDYVPVKINVPYTPMDEISEDGYIEARLKIYWNTLTATDPNDKLTPDTTAAAGSTSGSSGDDGEYSAVAGDAMDVTDSVTGIRFTAGQGAFSKGTRVYYNLSPIKSTYEKADAILNGSVDSYKLYVITAMLKRKIVQPKGYVTFYVPVGDIDIDKSVIYKITDATKDAAEGKTLIDFEISADREYFIFSLSTLGIIAICETDDPPPHKTRAPEITPTPVPDIFEDINSSGAKAEIETAVRNGWFNGIDDTRFGPHEELTRAMFITVLGRFCGGEASIDAENLFSDVVETEYYFPYVLWAHNNGIISGTGDGLFEPHSTLTREQMAVILYNFVNCQGIALKSGAGITFADADEMSDWAADAVNALVKSGLIGTSDRVFAPKKAVTRVDAVVVLCRLDEMIEEQQPKEPEDEPENISDEEINDKEINNEETDNEEVNDEN